jgi:hypothetical protein
MKITEDVRTYAAKQKIDQEQISKKAMEQKSREFQEKGGTLYLNA